MSNPITFVQVVNENGTWLDTLSDLHLVRYGDCLEVADRQDIDGYVVVLTATGNTGLVWADDVEGPTTVTTLTADRIGFSRQGRSRGKNVWFVSVDGVLNWTTVEQVQGGWLYRDTDGTLVGQGTTRLDAVLAAWS